jgi:hypothetical protein
MEPVNESVLSRAECRMMGLDLMVVDEAGQFWRA